MESRLDCKILHLFRYDHRLFYQSRLSHYRTLNMKPGNRFYQLALASLWVYLGAASKSVFDTDVIVVGGGPSGVTAAYELHRVGIRAIVLEAKDRLGGRSHSIKRSTGEGTVELGATWINNKTQPEVVALTELLGLDLAVQYDAGSTVHEDSQGVVHEVKREPCPFGVSDA
jgi:hypothetical protein